MRTEEAERAVKQLAKVYNDLRSLAMETRDERYHHQAEGIDIAVKTLGLDATAFMQLTLPEVIVDEVLGAGFRWR